MWRADTKQAPTHKHETHWLRDKRKGQRCLSLLISNKQHTFSFPGRLRISIQGKHEEERQTEQESRGKQAFPRITSALPGPAQFTTTKQAPRSHRGTSGQALSSLWKQQALLGSKGKLSAPLFCLTDIFKHTFASKRKWKAQTYMHNLWKLNCQAWLDWSFKWLIINPPQNSKYFSHEIIFLNYWMIAAQGTTNLLYQRFFVPNLDWDVWNKSSQHVKI